MNIDNLNFDNQKSLLGRRWKLKDFEERNVIYLSQRYNLKYIVAKLLSIRDIDNELVEVSGPNCEKIKHRPKGNKTEYNLITRRDIKAGEELTLHYTFYKPE